MRDNIRARMRHISAAIFALALALAGACSLALLPFLFRRREMAYARAKNGACLGPVPVKTGTHLLHTRELEMRDNIRARMRHISAAIFALALAGACSLALLPSETRIALAQGFPFVSPFTSVQPQNTTDFSNPPISFQAQGVTNVSTGTAVPQTVPIGSVAYGSFGNATTYISGQVFLMNIFVPFDMTVTNINVLNGGTVGTNACIVVLYNSAGTVLRTSALAGATTAGANAFQTYALTSSIAVQGPGRYFVGIQCNGATDNVRTVAASTFAGLVTQSNAGVFATIPAITPPTTFTANVGPIVYLN